MSLNLTIQTTYHVFDEYGMLIVPSDDLSWRDSLGRTVLAWVAYEEPEELLDSIEECWSNEQMKLYRHPGHNELSSRDHYSYFIIFEKFARPDSFYKLIRLLPRMRGLNLWMKSLIGNKRAEWWYYFWNIPFARIGNAWLRVCRKAGGISTVEYLNEDWIKICPDGEMLGHFIQRTRTVRQKLFGWIILNTIPAYALHIKAWQLYVMPSSKKRKKLDKILLKRVGKSNLMLRLLLEDRKDPNSGDNVTQEEIDNYPAMTGYRPGVYLDESCRRDIREMTPEESSANCYEVDLIKYLWNDFNNTG